MAAMVKLYAKKVDLCKAYNGTVRTYKLFIGENSQQVSRELTGTLDDVRIYGRALSAEEVADLVGRTKPIHKAF